MKQLVFLSTATSMGGGEYFLKELLPQLQSMGWKITLVVPPQAPLCGDSDLAKIAEIVPIDLSVKVRNLSVFLPSVLRFLLLAFRNRRAIFYSNGFFGMKILTPAKLLFSVKAVCHLHESEYGYYHTRRARWQAPLMDHFFAISTTVQNEFLEGSGVSREKITLVHNGVPIDKLTSKSSEWRVTERKALGLPLEGLLVGMAARTNALKGHETLLRAWRLVLDRHQGIAPILVLAGLERHQGEQAEVFDRICNTIREEKLADVITWATVPLHQVRRLMRCADIWVVPSTSEGFGRTAIEAMSEGTALTASNVGGLSDIVTNERDGVLVSAGDSSCLADAMMTLLNDASYREKLAKAGYETALRNFSLESMTARIDGTLMSLLSGN